MKRFYISLLLPAAAWSLAACSTDGTEIPQPAADAAEQTVTVRFAAESTLEEDDTKASLTPDDTDDLFQAAWEEEDCLGVYTLCDGSKKESNASLKYDGRYFSGTLKTQDGAAAWSYYAYYPYSSSNSDIPFGDSRTQQGNTFNGTYDLMAGSTENVANTLPGVDADGNPIEIAMQRRTAILYFHFSTEEAWAATEKVTRAELSADKYISGTVKYSDTKHDFEINSANRKNDIVLTFEEGTAPTAADLKAYFNIFTASSNIKFTLTVYTEGHKVTLQKPAATYEAGKLYRVSKTIPTEAWAIYQPGPLPAPELTNDAGHVSVSSDKIVVKWDAVPNATGYAYSYVHPVTQETVSGTTATPTVTIDGLAPETAYTFTLYATALGDGSEYLDSPESSLEYTGIETASEPVGGQSYTWDFSELITSTGNIEEEQTYIDNGKILAFVPGGSSKSAQSSGKTYVQLGGKSTIKSNMVTERYWYFTASGSGTLKITFCSNSATKTTEVIVTNNLDTSVDGAQLNTFSVTGSTPEEQECNLTISQETTLYIYATNETRYYKFEWIEGE